MSWGSGDDISPPPKPARYPMQGKHKKYAFFPVIYKLFFEN